MLENPEMSTKGTQTTRLIRFKADCCQSTRMIRLPSWPGGEEPDLRGIKNKQRIFRGIKGFTGPENIS